LSPFEIVILAVLLVVAALVLGAALGAAAAIPYQRGLRDGIRVGKDIAAREAALRKEAVDTE
jgi:hypothetical protein